MLVIIWHLLSDPNLEFVDLGADYYELPNTDPVRKKREHIRHLEALGYKVSSRTRRLTASFTPVTLDRQSPTRHQSNNPRRRPGDARTLSPARLRGFSDFRISLTLFRATRPLGIAKCLFRGCVQTPQAEG